MRLQLPHHATDDGVDGNHHPSPAARPRSASAWWWSARPSTTSDRRSRCSSSPTSTPWVSPGCGWPRRRWCSPLMRPPWTVWRAAGRDERLLVVALGRRPRGHERHLLPRPRPAAARDRRRHRVPRRHRARGVRRPHPSQRAARSRSPSPASRCSSRSASPAPRSGCSWRPRTASASCSTSSSATGSPTCPRSAAAPPSTGSASSWPSARVAATPLGIGAALPAVAPPDLAALGARRRHLLDGDPLPHRPARDGPAARARRTASCSRCFRSPPRRAASRCCTSCPAVRTWPGSRWSSRASPPTEPQETNSEGDPRDGVRDPRRQRPGRVAGWCSG